MSTSVGAKIPPRGALKLMVDPTFGGLFWAKMLSVVGVWTHCIVAAVVVFDTTESALMVGLVGVVQFGPQLILSPLSGKWADTGNPVRQIAIGRVLCGIGSGSIALCLTVFPNVAGADTALMVLAGSGLVGIGFVVGGPAMQSIVPSLIRDGELPTAMALNSVPMIFGRITGPLVGAILTAQLNAAAAFAVSGALSFVFVILIARVRFPAPVKRRPGTDYRVRAALSYVRSDRTLLVALLAVAAVGFAADPSITLAPSMARALGGDTHLVGTLSTAFGVGAAVALVVLALGRGRVASPRAASVGLWALTGGSVLSALDRGPISAISGFALAGIGFGFAMTGLSTMVQERAPKELRGRIMALWMVGFVGSRPAAAAALGGAADRWSVHASFTIAAAVTLAVVLLWHIGIRKQYSSQRAVTPAAYIEPGNEDQQLPTISEVLHAQRNSV